MKTLNDFLTEQIDSMSNDELMELNNAYCEAVNYPDDKIYNNDDDFLDEYFSKPSEAIRAVEYGSYKFTDRYATFNGYANLISYDNLTDNLCASVNEIVDYAIENPNEFNMLDFDFEEETEEED